MPAKRKSKRSPGPTAKRLKLTGPWGRAVKKALTKKPRRKTS